MSEAMCEIIIGGGNIVDGSNSDAYVGDVSGKDGVTLRHDAASKTYPGRLLRGPQSMPAAA